MFYLKFMNIVSGYDKFCNHLQWQSERTVAKVFLFNFNLSQICLFSRMGNAKCNVSISKTKVGAR